MELPELGQQCSQANCKKLDFLPLHCKCGKQFCSEHFHNHVKMCEVFERSEAVDLRKIENVHKCSKEGCNDTNIVPLICERCHQHFCVKHRHFGDCFEKTPAQIAAERERYAAPVREFEKAKSEVDKQVENKLNEAIKRGKNRETAQKIQLMKIKHKATGLKLIPTADRVYFNVTHPQSVSGKVSPVFVSKSWTVGRAIDAIASECKLQNNNNKSNEKKLRLFKTDTQEIISREVSQLIGTLLADKSIADGENLIIEYVEDACEHL